MIKFKIEAFTLLMDGFDACGSEFLCSIVYVLSDACYAGNLHAKKKANETAFTPISSYSRLASVGSEN